MHGLLTRIVCIEMVCHDITSREDGREANLHQRRIRTQGIYYFLPFSEAIVLYCPLAPTLLARLKFAGRGASPLNDERKSCRKGFLFELPAWQSKKNPNFWKWVYAAKERRVLIWHRSRLCLSICGFWHCKTGWQAGRDRFAEMIASWRTYEDHSWSIWLKVLFLLYLQKLPSSSRMHQISNKFWFQILSLELI